MRALLALCVTLLVTLFGSAPALARPAMGTPAGVEVRNDTPFAVDVYVDGTWRGEVERGARRILSSLPGHRHVTVRAHDLVLHDARMRLTPGKPVTVRVVPPPAELTLRNRGRAPLFVTVGDGDGFWLTPGERQRLHVAPGRTLVSTAVHNGSRLVPAEQHTLVLPAGRQITQDLTYSAPSLASRVTFRNLERRAVRVLVDGRVVAEIPPRSTREIAIPAGRHVVTLRADNGRVLHDAPVQVAGGRAYTVQVQNGVRVSSRRAA